MRRFAKRSKKLAVGKLMPPSFHKLPGEEFDPKKSETIQWLVEQPEVLNFLWDQYKQSGDLSYDVDTGLWVGVDYDD